MEEEFRAYGKYEDWSGTVVADDADHTHHIGALLEAKGLIKRDEFLVGFEAEFAEHFRSNDIKMYVRAFIASTPDFDTTKKEIEGTSGLFPLRTVSFDLPLKEFFDLFKQFTILVERKGLDLTGRTVEIKD